MELREWQKKEPRVNQKINTKEKMERRKQRRTRKYLIS